MRIRFTALLIILFPLGMLAQLPCTTIDAIGCVCAQSGQTDCDLLPDITVSAYALANYMGGPTEYPQMGAGVNNGRLRVTGSTPNIGFGPFTVGEVQLWVCGIDTFADYNTALLNCANPSQIIKQRIFHKNGGTMTYTERYAGTMTYHPSHGHMHVDDWAVFTLRIPTPDPNPLNWPIVGDGAKMGFCLMDYGSCSNFNGHCRDANNNILTNADFPNYMLGGGQYNCSPIEQGISVGWTDIYNENLEGMWINIPPGTCNGTYRIVIEVDPNNVFLESNENNNICVIPITLTQQVPNGQFVANVRGSGPSNICAGEVLTLTAGLGQSYLWNTGATTQAITVATAGTYTCTVTSLCGTDASDPVVITTSSTAQAPTAIADSACYGATATLEVVGSGNFDWYDAPTGGTFLGSGNLFTTPPMSVTTDYYVEQVEANPGLFAHCGPANGSIGNGSYTFNNARYLQFEAINDFVLQSVWVDAQSAGNRTIELRNADGTIVLGSVSQYIPAGPSRVSLGFNVHSGANYQLGLSSNSMVELFRNDAGTAYPYTISNLVTINTSSSGNQYYYFFYDWEVKAPDRVCISPRTAVTATAIPTPNVSISGLASTYFSNDPTAPLVGTPSGGTFSGPGISGNTFTPSLAGAGTHTITYTYVGPNGCEGVATMSTTVSQFVNLLGSLFDVMPTVFPNPHGGRYTLSFDLHGVHALEMEVFTVTGQSVMRKDYGAYDGSFREEFDMTKMARGVYFLELRVDDQKVRTKMVYH